MNAEWLPIIAEGISWIKEKMGPSKKELILEMTDLKNQLQTLSYGNAAAIENMEQIILDDIDTTVGEWEQTTGTVNHQGILAFLMHIADNPVHMENVGSVNRVPVFLTGNNFNLLYEPLRRTGRTIKFDWEPTREEKINIVSSIFSFTDDKLAELLVDMYPKKEISFFSSIYAEKCISFLSDISSNATFKTLLKNSNYVKQLYDLYMAKKKSISWQEVFSNLEVGGTNNEHDKN